MDNRFYTIKGIATEFPPDNQFYIEMMDQKLHTYYYEGDSRLSEIDRILAELYDLMMMYMFADADKYYEIIGSLPLADQIAGYDSDCQMDVEQFEALLKRIRGKTIIERDVMLVDTQFLIGSIQNLLQAMHFDFINYFISLSEVDARQTKDGDYCCAGYVCSQPFSFLTSYITRAYSVMDILTKLAFEFDNDLGAYTGITKLRSRNKLFGHRKYLSIYGQAGTVFENSNNNCIGIIESLRNELVHNGSWELTQKIFIRIKNGEVLDRYICWPQSQEGHLTTIVNRKRFFSEERTANEILVQIHSEYLERLFITVSLMKTEYTKRLPKRTFETLLGISYEDALLQVASYYSAIKEQARGHEEDDNSME